MANSAEKTLAVVWLDENWDSDGIRTSNLLHSMIMGKESHALTHETIEAVLFEVINGLQVICLLVVVLTAG